MSHSVTGLEVAVIGMAGRFPGAQSVDELWQLFRNGEEGLSFFSDEELLAAGVPESLLADPRYVKCRGIVKGAEEFDAAFFGMTPREAEITDPQQRLFLEVAWSTLEDGGYDPDQYKGAVGVYAAVTIDTYLLFNILSHAKHAVSVPVFIGNDKDHIAARASYKMNLRGPAVVIQTACSSSLVAVHQACQSLLAGECDMALAGGSSITVPIYSGYLFEKGGIYSPDGHCRAFDAQAEGTVGGMGTATVLLKRLQDAIDDGDCIRAVIKGSAINNDGSAKVGYAAPSLDGQSRVVSRALSMADVSPDSIGYVETHGTGTPLGDPIEIAALTRAYRRKTDRNGYCAIGSFKSNLGHLDSAAGVTGLIKAALSLQHGEIFPSLHYDTPNPKIDFESSPFFVNTELRDWPRGAEPRRAAVSSFGMGGTNVHAVLEEPPAPAPSGPSRPWQMLPLAARVRSGLTDMAARLADHLEANPDLSLADVAFTLQTGRHRLNHRQVLVCDTREDAIAQLRHPAPDRVQSLVEERKDCPVAFLFPGQGSQFARMGRELVATEPRFRQIVDQCAEHLLPRLGVDLRTLMFDLDGDTAGNEEKLRQTAITQPALFTIEYALACVWMSWGIRPQAMIGHSIGEYVAACLAGVFSLEDALDLVAERGRLMQSLPAGSMLSVPLPQEEVATLIGGDLELAAVNDRQSCVVSGPTPAIEELARRLEEKDIPGRVLHTSHAFHSAMMEPILAEFTARVEATRRHAPSLPYVSNLTGTWVTDAQATDPAYWAQHLRRTVRFADGIDTMLAEPNLVLLEVGPGNTLGTLAQRVARARGGERPTIVSSMRHPKDSTPEPAVLMKALGRVWMSGARIDWKGLYAGEQRRRIPLPTYPFQRQRYWIDPARGRDHVAASPADKLPDIEDWFYEASWKRGAWPRRTTSASRHCLLFLGADPVGPALRDSLREAGHRVTTVEAGDSFAANGEDAFTVRPGSPEDHRALVDAVMRSETPPDRAVHCWSADPLTAADPVMDRGFYSVLFLAQALDRLDLPTTFDLSVVSREAQSVTGMEPLVPEKALLIGVGRGIHQELKSIDCRCIDLEAPAVGDRAAQEAEWLHTEVLQPWRADALAYRGRHRWTPDYLAVPRTAPEGRPSRLREHGVYVVIGGLGAIGMEVADSLAQGARARLVLVGRSEFPPPERWDALLTGDAADDLTRRRIQKIRAMESSGAEVLTVQADVADADSLRAALAQAEARFGAVHGVVHAAGGDKTMVFLSETTRQACEDQFRSKVQGLRVLEEVLEDRDLDLVVVQSSLSSVLGALGVMTYASAHQYVDAFVMRHNRDHALAWDRINWDNWLNWKETDITGSEEGAAAHMEAGEGRQAFLRVLDGEPGAQVAISCVDLLYRLQQWVGGEDEAEEADDGSELHDRPELSNDFEAPRDDVERTLAGVWGRALGIERIGIHDNFFELGGDSVIGLQVVSKARQAGVEISPNQIFEFPTIAALAAAAGQSVRVTAEQGEVTGEVPLTPIQHWFHDLGVPNPDHFNLPVLMVLPRERKPEHIEQALTTLLRHHDMLRARYRGENGSLEQFLVPADGEFTLEQVTLEASTEAERSAAVRPHAERLHLAVNLEQGPVMRVARFDFGPGQPVWLLWIVHHLAIDVVSWRVLIEDFQQALEQLGRGQEVKLPDKTTSFQAWAKRLVQHAGEAPTLAELDYWKGAAGRPNTVLPVDSSEGANDLESSDSVSVTLDRELTQRLLSDTGRTSSAEEILLTTLVRTLSTWAGGSSFWIDLERHGREDLFEDVDLTRTVGWFTTMYPAPLDLGEAVDVASGFQAIREQLRSIPRNGFGHGLLRHLSGDPAVNSVMRELPQPEVSFLYLGQFGSQGDDTSVRWLDPASGPACDPHAPRPHLLEMVALITEGQLRVEWEFSRNRHQRATIETLSRRFQEQLTSVLDAAMTPSYTAADFPAARVSQEELDKLLGGIDLGDDDLE